MLSPDCNSKKCLKQALWYIPSKDMYACAKCQKARATKYPTEQSKILSDPEEAKNTFLRLIRCIEIFEAETDESDDGGKEREWGNLEGIFQRYREKLEPLQKLLEEAETHKVYHKFTELEDLALSILSSLQEEDLFRKFTTKRFCDNPEADSSEADLDSFKTEINQKHKKDIDELCQKYETEKDRLLQEKDNEIAALEQKIITLRRETEAQSKDKEMEENTSTDAHLTKKIALKRETKLQRKRSNQQQVKDCEENKCESYSNQEFDAVWKEATNEDMISALFQEIHLEMNNILHTEFLTKLKKRIPNLEKITISHIPDDHEQTRDTLTTNFPEEVKEFHFHVGRNYCSFDYFFPPLIAVAPCVLETISLHWFRMTQSQVESVFSAYRHVSEIYFRGCLLKTDKALDFKNTKKISKINKLLFMHCWNSGNVKFGFNASQVVNLIAGLMKMDGFKTNLKTTKFLNCGVTKEEVMKIFDYFGLTEVEILD
ncbi:unnamed protein product [Moneuplotes crassus]|uniref:Uncharacterized protein n=1 Tax=Euplotes crassus TaxID=5936 RepID=A0AAD1UAV5_EUPCR|nr:unnamed protein product [Moneuplotes crassus]